MIFPFNDIIDSKIFKPILYKAKRKALINICKIFSLNDSVELINMPHVFHDLSRKA